MGWNIVEDAINAIQEWFKGILSDGIIGTLENTCNTLNNTFSTENQGVMKSLLSDNPSNFTGSTSASATPIWSGIETLTNNAIVPIAIFILVVVIMYELIHMVINDNSFRDFDTGIFFKWAVKAVTGIMLVSNVFYIATNIFGLGSAAVTSGLNTIFPASGRFLDGVDFATIREPLKENLMTLYRRFVAVIVLGIFNHDNYLYRSWRDCYRFIESNDRNFHVFVNFSDTNGNHDEQRLGTNW